MVDSGAERVCRPPEFHGEENMGRVRRLDLAGDCHGRATELPSGELVLKGEPLLPMGGVVRLADLTWLWHKKHGPCWVKLRDQDSDLIGEIMSRYPDAVRPAVDRDMPYITESQARVIRDKIRLDKPDQKVEELPPIRTMLAELYNKRTQAQSAVAYIGRISAKFTAWLLKNADRKNKFDEWRNLPDFSPGKVGEILDESSSMEEFFRDVSALYSNIGDDVVSVSSHGDASVKESSDSPSRKVTFGPDSHVHFFRDDASEVEEDLRIETDTHPITCRVLKKRRETKEETSLDEHEKHCLTHHPMDPRCEVCCATKRMKKRFQRGSARATGKDHQGRKIPLVVMDWVNPSQQASNGAKYMAVLGLIADPEDESAETLMYARGFQTKANNSHLALEDAVKKFGLEGMKFELHSDNEGVLKCAEVKAVLKKCMDSESSTGIPRCPNTNSRAERIVRSAAEGVRALLYEANLPRNLWHLAADCWTTERLRQAGRSPRVNTVKPVPFGTLGEAVLPQGVTLKDKFETRTCFVASLGVDPESSGGVRVLYPGADGVIRRARILDRDVTWSAGVKAFSRERKDLQDVCSLFPAFVAENRVHKDQIACDSCDKWRFVTEDMLKKIGDGRVTCTDIGTSCEMPQDPRVWEQFEFEKVVEEDQPRFDVDTEETQDEVLIAKRCNVAAQEWCKESDLKEFTTGKEFSTDSLENDVEMQRALLRLASGAVGEEKLAEMRRTAELEIRAEKCDSVKVCAVVVSGKDALAADNPDRAQWVGAMNKEEASLFNRGVFGLADIGDVKEGDEILPSLIVFTRKNDGRFKGRIVACGNFQKTPSEENYAGVISHDGWLSNIVMATRLGLETYQIDVETAFLQTGTIDDDPDRVQTYLRPPREVKKENDLSNKVLWKVLKSVYGLKSAPSAWKKTLTRWLLEIGFKTLVYDDCVLVRDDGIAVMLYVDDLVVTAPREIGDKFMSDLMKRFDCTEPCRLSDATRDKPLDLLGHAVWVESGEKGKKIIHVSQLEYAKKLVARFGMDGANPLTSLRSEDYSREFLEAGEPLDAAGLTLLRGLVGGIAYLAQCTRLDLLAPVSVLAEGQAKGTVNHVNVAKKLIRYIAGTMDRHLRWEIDPLEIGGVVPLEIMFDASFGCERGRSGGIVLLSNCPVFWFSRRQRCIVLSTAEAELVCASTSARELNGTRNALREVWGPGSRYKIAFQLSMTGDNQAANLISSRQCSLRKVRHLCLGDLYVRQLCGEEQMIVRFTPTAEMSADCLTKVLPEPKLEPLLSRIGLVREEA